MWVGIAGSAAIIGVWVVSRTLGLWFVEGGEPEPVGVADSLASLTEAWTIVLLGAGDFTLASLRLAYRTTEAGAFTFASQVATCSGACDAQ